MKRLTRTAVALAVVGLATPALAQDDHKPISSTVQINVVMEKSEPIKDLPDKHIRWYPPVHEFSDRDVTFIDLVSKLSKKVLQIGCAGGFSQYPDTSMPATNPPSTVTVEIKVGLGNKTKKFATKTANVTGFTGAFIALVQKKIKASTTFFEFWITHDGAGNMGANTLASYNCGVFAIDGKNTPRLYGRTEVVGGQ